MQKIVSYLITFFVLAFLIFFAKSYLSSFKPPPLEKQTPAASKFDAYLAEAKAQMVDLNYLAALEQYKKAAQVEPRNSFVREQMALIYQKRRVYNDAIQEYQFAIAAGSARASELFKIIGDLYFATDQWQKAKENYLKALELGWIDTEIYLVLGKTQIWLSDFWEAKDSFGKALAIEPNDISARFYFSLVSCLDNLEFARIDMQKVSESFPQTEREKQNVSDAKVFLDYIKQAEQPKQRDWAGVYLAKGFNAIGLPTLAVAVIQPVISKNPDYAQAYLFLGRAYYLLQKHVEAKTEFDKYFKIAGKNDAIAWFYLGDNFYAEGDISLAISALQNAISLDNSENQALYYFKLAQSYEAEKNYSAAVSAYKKAIEKKFKDKKTWLKIINLNILELSNPAEAIQTALKAKEIFPEEVEVINALGWAYLENKEFDKSIEVLQKAKEMDPEFFLIYFNLGRIYKSQGKVKEAKIMFVKVLNLDFSGNIAKTAEKELKNLEAQSQLLFNGKCFS